MREEIGLPQLGRAPALQLGVHLPLEGIFAEYKYHITTQGNTDISWPFNPY